MAKFKLYSDIVGEEEKVFLQAFGMDGHCYKDINEFISSIPEDDNVIDIRIHCRGGSCVEGWAMYDALRRSKKKIYTTVEGECSSMATIILLAAPIERRTAYKNAHFCIHNPAVMCLDTDFPKRLTADGLNTIRTQIGTQESALREEQERILELYVARTNASRKELQDLMNQDTYINTKRAQELGFISKTLVPNTALKISSQINPSTMSKQKTVAVSQSLFNRMLAKFGVSKVEDIVLRDQVVTAADGQEFTVEREDGDPQVGDTAYPDGSYTMQDGTVIVIEDNIITSITPGEPEADPSQEPEPADPDDPNAVTGDPAPAGDPAPEGDPEGEPAEGDLQPRVTELEGQVAELQERVAELEKERDDLKDQVDSKKDARVLTDEENAILDAVAKAGGKSWLDSVINMRSTFSAGNRRFVDHSPSSAPEGETLTQRLIREQKERFDKSQK